LSRNRKFIFRFARRLLLAVCLLTSALFASASHAQERAYWLLNGATVKGSCDGSRDGVPMRAANGGVQWILITAVITCRDLGTTYSYEIDHLTVQINPKARERISRPALSFDWVGLAVYQPQGSGETISWTYDEALGIHGSIDKTSNGKIVFGRLKFPAVNKADLERATNFTLYMISEGAIFAFGLI
jgi:hypothetical protein